MKISDDGLTIEVSVTVESVEANAGILARFDPALKDLLLRKGVSLIASPMVPPDQLWVVMGTEDGARATAKYAVDPQHGALTLLTNH